jgi:tRNA G18 (ribose-2'-O)-methylase SpoU
MVNFSIVNCTNPDCDLRMPLDLDQFSGKYCPRCGQPMAVVGQIQTHKVAKEETYQPKRTLVVILDNIRSAYNVGAFFRTADGVRVKLIHLCGITPNPVDNPLVAKTALGAEKQVPWMYHANALRLVERIKAQGLTVLALERTDTATPVNMFQIDPSSQHTLALIFGNEKAGVDPGLLDLCTHVISIPMLGDKASLNVAVAFGIAAYWLSFI